MNHLTAAHGEPHVREGCGSSWRGLRGEHGDCHTDVSLRTVTTKLTFVPHVATDADAAPHRGEWQTHSGPAALILRPTAASERNVA